MTTRSTSTRSPVQLAAAVVSVVFVLVGILGFIPGAIDYDALQLAGTQSDALLLGIFQVSVLHNIVHLLFGVVGLAMSRTAAAARTFLIGGGLIYVVLWLYGLFIDLDSAANFVPLNTADNWLHLALAAGMILLGVVLPRRAA